MSKKEFKGRPIALAYYPTHLNKVVKPAPTIATKINRNFYKNLRKRGNSHNHIIRMIQPDRRNQFIQDIQLIKELPPPPISKIPWWKKIINPFKLLFTLSLFLMILKSDGQVPTSDIVSVVSVKKDTLFLARNEVGCQIMDVWARYPNERPVIILKSEEWIIRENKKRKKE